jgi:hypothetical protein
MNIFVVLTRSAYLDKDCILGQGVTKKEAIEDAFGPKSSWGNSSKRSYKNSWVKEMTEDEFNAMREANY